MRIGAPVTGMRRGLRPGSRTSSSTFGARTTGISKTRVPPSAWSAPGGGSDAGETSASTSASPGRSVVSGQERDARPLAEGVAVGAGEAQRAGGELGGDLVGGIEAGEVVGMEADRELVGHEAAPTCRRRARRPSRARSGEGPGGAGVGS